MVCDRRHFCGKEMCDVLIWLTQLLQHNYVLVLTVFYKKKITNKKFDFINKQRDVLLILHSYCVKAFQNRQAQLLLLFIKMKCQNSKIFYFTNFNFFFIVLEVSFYHKSFRRFWKLLKIHKVNILRESLSLRKW